MSQGEDAGRRVNENSLLTDKQKEMKRSKDRQRRRDQRVSEKLRVDEIALLSAKNDRLTKRLSDVMQP
jgi:hypothetical protein